MAKDRTAPARFRAVLEGERCVYPATVSDPLSALIAEDLGFESGILAGSIAALEILAAPDRVLMTLSELAEQARRITRACRLPILVDGDHGYGNALNVMRTVEELEAAGIAAVSIEDTVLPEPFGGSAGRAFISIEEGVAKMRAALAARSDPSFVIVARTSAVGGLGLEEAIARGRAYAAAGVDALFFPALTSAKDVEALGAALDLPLIVSGVKQGSVSLDWLAGHGARLVLPGHLPFYAGLKGVHDALKTLRDTGTYGNVAPVPLADAGRWSGEDVWAGRVRDFLGRDRGKP